MTGDPIYVARPLVPLLEELSEVLAAPFRTRRLTNDGPLVNLLELRLAEMLRVPHVSMVANGTVAIEIAARALDLKGKVITTPFSFPASLTALLWLGLEPVLVDIEEDYLTIAPEAIEAAVTGEASGILGVHVYGTPCDLDAIDSIARQHSLAVVYDGAHAFDGVMNGVPIVAAGDATTLSFHATKIFNCAEGGAVVTTRDAVSRRVELIRNFGIESEDSIVEIGINGKCSEVHAALGLANLGHLRVERDHRVMLRAHYANAFAGHKGIRLIPERPGSIVSPQYFVIRLPRRDGVNVRDRVYNHLRARGIFARRYFYPLLSDVPAFRARLSQTSFEFPNAAAAAAEVLALPLHGGVGMEDANLIENLVLEAVNE